jgi:hypothetical protein
MFDLKKYTYEIFCIAGENDMDIGVGRDMFLANVRAGDHLYSGEHTIPDYKALKREYDNSTDTDIIAALQDYSNFTKANYKELTQMYVKKDIEGFKRLCGVISFNQPAVEETEE